MILSPQLGFEGLCAIHSLPYSRGTYASVVSVVKKLSLFEPPSCALRLDRPADAALVGNVQLLLQSSTPNGGSSSRSVSFPSTIAVAIEMIRDGGLNFTVACIRHGVKMADYGKSESHVLERITAVRDRILKYKLLERDHSRPISRAAVNAVRARISVSIADAADAVAHHPDDVDAAVEHLRSALGLEAPVEDESEEAKAARMAALLDEPLCRRLQPHLRQKTVSPALKTIAVAVRMCREEDLDIAAACSAIECRTSHAGIRLVYHRIKELKLLEQIAEEDAARASEPASVLRLDEALADGGVSGEGGGVADSDGDEAGGRDEREGQRSSSSSSSSSSLASSPPPRPRRMLRCRRRPSTTRATSRFSRSG